jgi:hypothetical protein
MKLVIKIEMDNAAFEEDPAREAARILEGLASRIRGSGDPVVGDVVYYNDISGNKVAKAMVVETSEQVTV